MVHNYTQQVKKQADAQGRGKTLRASAMTMLSNPNTTGQAREGQTGRPFTDEKNRPNFDINQNLKEINADLSSKGEGFVRIQQESSKAGGFGTQANATSQSSKSKF